MLQGPWESATVTGIAFAMSSTAIVMGTLGERGELASGHGRTSFALLIGLFVIAVGLSIEAGALLRACDTLLVHVPVVLAIKGDVLMGLALTFGIGRSAAIRTGVYLPRVGDLPSSSWVRQRLPGC